MSGFNNFKCKNEDFYTKVCYNIATGKQYYILS